MYMHEIVLKEVQDYCCSHGCNYCWFSQAYNPTPVGGHVAHEDKKSHLNQVYGTQVIERCRFELLGIGKPRDWTW